MKVTEVRYTRRFNTAKYEHEEYTASASLDEGENPVKAVASLKEVVQAAHEGTEIPWGEETEKSNAPDTKKSKKKAQAAKPKDEDEDAPVETLEEAEDDEDDNTPDNDDDAEAADTDSDEDDAASSDDDDEAEETKPTAKKRGRPAGSGKSFKKKSTPYSRDVDTHKNLFGKAFDKALPGFRATNAGRVKTISMKLNGEEFLDADGNVLPEFIKKAVKLAKAKVA